MGEALRFLSSQKLVPIAEGNKKAFKEILYNLWFELHPRPSGDGTHRSAFEHVFVGETSGRQILGFHNWVQLYEEERRGNVIYQGCKAHACGDQIITIDFSWNGKRKTFGSFFLGTSPEFELAIYTVCFLAGRKETTVTFGNDIVTIVTCIENGQIGACYPKLQPQGQIQMPEIQLQDVLIPIDSEENSTPEEDQEIEDEQETSRLITPGENQLPPATNGEVRIPIDHDDMDFLRRRHERKAIKDPFWCNCTIL